MGSRTIPIPTSEELFQQARLRKYQNRNEEDLLLAIFFSSLMGSEDAIALNLRHKTLFGFLALARSPNSLYYIEDSGKIEFALWLVRSELGTHISLFVHKDYRQSVLLYKVIKELHRLLLLQEERLFALALRARVDLYTRFGYEVVGTIPQYFRTEDGVLLVVTPEKEKRR